MHFGNTNNARDNFIVYIGPQKRRGARRRDLIATYSFSTTRGYLNF